MSVDGYAHYVTKMGVCLNVALEVFEELVLLVRIHSIWSVADVSKFLLEFLPCDTTQSVVMRPYVVRPSVRPTVCNVQVP